MYKEVLRSIDGVGMYPVLSFIIFGLFFISLLVYTFSLKKEQVKDLSELPLKEDNNNLEY